tara:strand:+ start:675 stop:791 length:117 start_codon:yes stop_codon:yes gene_type:complete
MFLDVNFLDKLFLKAKKHIKDEIDEQWGKIFAVGMTIF